MGDEYTAEELEMLRLRAKKSVTAAWKILDDKEDPMYTKSYSQSLLDYIPPAEGTVPTEHRHPRGQFGEYLNKAIQLKVNLKSTAH